MLQPTTIPVLFTIGRVIINLEKLSITTSMHSSFVKLPGGAREVEMSTSNPGGCAAGDFKFGPRLVSVLLPPQRCGR